MSALATPPNETKSEPKRLLKLKDVIHLYAVSKTTIYRLMSEGKFPPSVKAGGARWRATDLEKWAAGLKAA